MKDGSIMMKNGSKKMLVNGECVDINKMNMQMKMMDNMKDSML